MSRRNTITMTDDEVTAYLHGRRTMNVASIGPDGRVHLVAMWYGFLPDDAPAFWTYRRSQKVLNLQRDPRITCLVESGDTYAELKGVELVGTATIFDAPDDVTAIGRNVYERYNGEWNDAAAAGVAAMGAKRVGVRIDVDKVVSWDHAKLGGTY
jgi:PPOX class probable F420-dependent enzyme